MPYPCSYAGDPYRLTPTLQPGESGRFHSANNLSTLEEVNSAEDRLHAATKHTLPTVMTDTQAAIACVFIVTPRLTALSIAEQFEEVNGAVSARRHQLPVADDRANVLRPVNDGLV